jgi:hypothetical protein
MGEKRFFGYHPKLKSPGGAPLEHDVGNADEHFNGSNAADKKAPATTNTDQKVNEAV